MCHDVSCQALLDEPSSGLDEEAEAHLFSSLQSSCAAFLSIGRLNWAMFFIDAMAAEYVCVILTFHPGHHASLRRFHTHELRIMKNGSHSFDLISAVP
jgi:hypothetical protein